MNILISTQRGGGKRRDNKSFDLNFDFLASFFILRFSFDSEHLGTRGDTTWLPLVLWKSTTLVSGWKPTGTSMV